jgi:hypothetical protein
MADSAACDEYGWRSVRISGCSAERTNVRHPFAPGGAPILSTRAKVRRHLAQAPGRVDGIQRVVTDLVFITMALIRRILASRIFRLGFVALTLAFGVWYIAEEWGGIHKGLNRIGLPAALGAVACVPAAATAIALVSRIATTLADGITASVAVISYLYRHRESRKAAVTTGS